MSKRKRPPVMGIDRMTTDRDCTCRVCGCAPKVITLIYFNELLLYLCPLCEGTLLSILLTNYLRRKRRRKPVVDPVKYDIDEAEPTALEELCD